MTNIPVHKYLQNGELHPLYVESPYKPHKYVLPKPIINWDGLPICYNLAEVLGNYDIQLKQWEKGVAYYELDYAAKLQVWQTTEDDRIARMRKNNQLLRAQKLEQDERMEYRKRMEKLVRDERDKRLAAQEYQKHIEKLAREEMRKEKERNDVAAMVKFIKEYDVCSEEEIV